MLRFGKNRVAEENSAKPCQETSEQSGEQTREVSMHVCGTDEACFGIAESYGE